MRPDGANNVASLLGWFAVLLVFVVPAANSFVGLGSGSFVRPRGEDSLGRQFTGAGAGRRSLQQACGAGRRKGAMFKGRGVALKMMEEVECDVVIVGGGPAGCTCALYTARADLKTVIVDKNPAVGALAITSHIANYPGVDKSMSGEELLDQMRKQAVDYGTDYRRAQVFLVDVEGESKYVYTPEATFKARSLVLATGAMGRKPSFEGEDTFLGRGVSYCATCDGAFYRDAEVAVVGVNQEAVEEAEFLTKFASTVHWITPGADPREDDEHAQRLLAKPNVKHWSKTNMVRIEGDDSGVTGIVVKSKEIGDEDGAGCCGEVSGKCL